MQKKRYTNFQFNLIAHGGIYQSNRILFSLFYFRLLIVTFEQSSNVLVSVTVKFGAERNVCMQNVWINIDFSSSNIGNLCRAFRHRGTSLAAARKIYSCYGWSWAQHTSSEVGCSATTVSTTMPNIPKLKSSTYLFINYTHANRQQSSRIALCQMANTKHYSIY